MKRQKLSTFDENALTYWKKLKLNLNGSFLDYQDLNLNQFMFFIKLKFKQNKF